MSIEEKEKEEGAYLEYEHEESGIIPEAEPAFSGGDMHINYEVESVGAGLDEERLEEELSDV